MKLHRLGQNAHTLETSAGALLFSYEKAVALRLGVSVFRLPGECWTTATRAHLTRFLGGSAQGSTAAVPKDFARYTRVILEAGLRDLEQR